MNARILSQLTQPVSDSDHIQGSDEALVTLLEYGDFECPACGAAYPVVKNVQGLFGEQVRVAFRHFPLTQLHPHAQIAAEASEAAAAQGRFWEMHDLLFENQDALDPEDLLRYAMILNLDTKRFRSDVENGVYAPKVRDDFLSGARSGVNGTPTFFINGMRHDGGYELRSLVAGVEQELASESARR